MLSNRAIPSHLQVTREELDAAAAAVAPFGSDNRAGIAGTLHRISALRSRQGSVVGLTCRVGRAVSGHVDMINDILEGEVQDAEQSSVGPTCVALLVIRRVVRGA
jgi:stage III sporulation protein SpoIIIAA